MILKIKKIILLLFIFSINPIYSNEIQIIEINTNSNKISLKEKAYVLYDDDRQYNIENIIKERKITSYFRDFTKNLIGFYNRKIWIYFQTKSQLEYE